MKANKNIECVRGLRKASSLKSHKTHNYLVVLSTVVIFLSFFISVGC